MTLACDSVADDEVGIRLIRNPPNVPSPQWDANGPLPSVFVTRWPISIFIQSKLPSQNYHLFRSKPRFEQCGFLGLQIEDIRSTQPEFVNVCYDPSSDPAFVDVAEAHAEITEGPLGNSLSNSQRKRQKRLIAEQLHILATRKGVAIILEPPLP